MDELSPKRRREVGDALTAAVEWAEGQPAVAGVAVVGSWARDAARMSSDVDLVVLTDAPSRYLENDDWLAAFDAVVR